MFRTNKFILLLAFSAQVHPTIKAINIDISSIWNFFGYNDGNDNGVITSREQLMFPRRDLVQELGGHDEYQRLVNHALGVVEEEKEKEEEQMKKEEEEQKTKSYGVDNSFPMHHLEENNNDDIYHEYIQGCNEYYNSKASASPYHNSPYSKTEYNTPCHEAEQTRLDMNLNQPPLMQNYTMLGFQKTTIPKDLHQMLFAFWKKHSMKEQIEVWDKGEGVDALADTHVNHWVSPTYMVHIDNPYYEGGGMELKNYIWHVARQKLERWINNGGNGGSISSTSISSNNDNNASIEGRNYSMGSQDNEHKWTLSPTSLYGIRVYKENSILAPHVDRLPLVTSAIINVDQDLDEDWPLEVIGHDGVAYNITMKPGDMLLYESHSIIHGRPYPLKGKYYANIFVHFEPSGHCIRHADRFDGKDVIIDDAKVLYERAQANMKQKIKDRKKAERERLKRRDPESIISAPTTPAYIAPDSLEGKRWNQKLEYEKKKDEVRGVSANLHRVSARGNLAEIIFAFNSDPKSVLKTDANGWQPLHEAARGGHLPIVKFLIEEARADKNARTGHDGKGGSLLWWAQKYHSNRHPVITYLKGLNAKRILPGEGDREWEDKLKKQQQKKSNDDSDDSDSTEKVKSYEETQAENSKISSSVMDSKYIDDFDPESSKNQVIKTIDRYKQMHEDRTKTKKQKTNHVKHVKDKSDEEEMGEGAKENEFINAEL